MIFAKNGDDILITLSAADIVRLTVEGKPLMGPEIRIFYIEDEKAVEMFGRIDKGTRIGVSDHGEVIAENVTLEEAVRINEDLKQGKKP